MKLKLLLLLTFLSLNTITFGQICGTPSYYESQQQKSSTLKSGNSLYLNNSTSICVNVKYHIVRESNGTGGFISSNLSNVTNRLNAAFNEHKIYFNSIGYDFIDNSTYYNIDDPKDVYTEYDLLVQINNDPNAINIYLVNGAEAYDGAARYKNNYAVIVNSSGDSTTTPHEVGHCFDLIHTHENGNENIDGSNCTWAGDKVCDTPADPGLFQLDNNGLPIYLVDINCNYTGGNGYNPDTNNIMSYSRRYCREHFTSGQNTRMRQAFAASSVLQNVVSISCSIPELNGNSTICYSNSIFTLQNGGTSVAWQVSSNLQIISSNNSSITVKSQSTNVSGQGFIKAVLPYETLQKDVWVGKADVDFVLFSNGIGETDYFCSSHTGNTYEIFPKLSDATHQIRLLKYPSLSVVYSSSLNYSGDTGTLNYTPLPGWYVFEVRRTNSCGTSDWFGYEVEFVDCSQGGGESEYLVFPNPATESLTIEKIKTNQLSEIMNNQPNYLIENILYEFYDINMNLILNGTIFDFNSIDVSTLKRGTYILKINVNKHFETHKIIIN